MGRSKLDIDEKRVRKLIQEGASNREIADIMGVNDTTIAEHFPALLRKERAERRLKLRKAQWNSAMKGNSAILIWLGKQELDQQERPSSATNREGEIDGVAILQSLMDRLATRIREEPGDPLPRPEGGS